MEGGGWYGFVAPLSNAHPRLAGTVLLRPLQRSGTVEIWTGDQRLAVHPRAEHPGQRFTAPGQWEGLPRGDGRPQQEAVAVQVTVGDVERRSLDVYELAALGGVR